MPTPFDREDLQSAIRIMREGGIILYPTDTVWGIGCDATNAEAVKKIYELKRREDSKSMLVLLDAAGRLRQYVNEIPDAALTLLDVTEPVQGDSCPPMTIIYPGAKNLAENLISEDGSIGIRLTDELFSRSLCTGLGKPIVSTSANISGEATPKTYQQISEAIRNGVDYICNYRRNDTEAKKPSSIIKVGLDNSIEIIRK